MPDWEAEGLLEGLDGPQRDARRALLDTLEAEGFELAEIKRSHADGELLFLLAGRAIDVKVAYTWPQVIEETGLSEALVERLIRAQGLARAENDEVSYTDADIAMLRTTSGLMEAGVPEADVVTVGRLLGRGFAQAAEAMRGTAMRIVLEPGLDERELAVRYAHAAGALVPMIEPLLGNLLKLHLSKLVQTEMINAEEREAGRLPGARDVNVAFADLVGFTRLGEEVPPDELGAVAGRLEEIVLDLIEPPVRFVKSIGDAVMVVSQRPEPLLETCLRLVEAADGEGENFPQLRAGVACGPALSRSGDWYGRPVNLASRVTTIARPGSVLAADAVRDAVPDAYAWSKAGIRHLKGIPDPVPLWRARRMTTTTDDE
ncbi:MAG: adenylate/guanylate cyclase protein [Solirubrobacteraceae bacterium]|nr:adenylate/guanylate cyclase protein [Solirubrobacteraceae bacterium]